MWFEICFGTHRIYFELFLRLDQFVDIFCTLLIRASNHSLHKASITSCLILEWIRHVFGFCCGHRESDTWARTRHMLLFIAGHRLIFPVRLQCMPMIACLLAHSLACERFIVESDHAQVLITIYFPTFHQFRTFRRKMWEAPHASCIDAKTVCLFVKYNDEARFIPHHRST